MEGRDFYRDGISVTRLVAAGRVVDPLVFPQVVAMLESLLAVRALKSRLYAALEAQVPRQVGLVRVSAFSALWAEKRPVLRDLQSLPH